MAHFEVYKDNSSYYRWRLKGANSEIVAVSSESYTTKQSAINSADWVKKNAPGATIYDVTGETKAAASGYRW